MAPGINPTLHTGVLAALEAALNRALELAPAARGELQALEDKIFAIECSSPPFELYLQPVNGAVRLMGICEEPATTRVRGAAGDFTELATASDPAATLINGNLEIQGDSAPLIELQQILSRIDMDWEAPLVDTLGDVAGHQLAELLRGVFSWGRSAGDSLRRQISEFILEEARLSPPKLELEDFYRDVQSLGMQVERLESRSQRLRQRLKRLKGE